jgi:transcriptional regulator with XRE-family HTH domain
MTTPDFAARLSALMAERGVGVRALARRVPCDPGYVSQLASGRRRPSAKIAARIDEVLAAGGDLSACARDASRTAALRPAARAGMPAAAGQEQGLGLGLGLDELRHISAAIQDARRYLDADIVTYFSDRIAWLAAADGAEGPRAALPAVLGVVAAVEQSAGQVRPGILRSLLGAGAQAAEFAGWLYRDAGAQKAACYWRDRAMEWAQEAGNLAFQGYVLLRKSQAAWDERDALHMLTLAQAAQDAIWGSRRRYALRRPSRRHERTPCSAAIPGLMHRKLDEARQLMAAAADSSAGQCAGMGANPHLLAMQTAICCNEAGWHERAVELYAGQLTETAFSRRDYGYFRALMGQALAAASQPREACRAGMDALAISRGTGSARTTRELQRLAVLLRPWPHLSGVRELQDGLAGR